MNIEGIKKSFPKGTRVELINMPDDPQPVPPGTKGVVRLVDDIGTIFVDWENGQRLGLVLGVDSFKIIE